MRGARRSGTPLDDRPAGSEIRLPGLWSGLATFVVLAVAYALFGLWIAIDQHVVVPDALDRLARAFMVWHDDPRKLAAIGFRLPPLTTFALLPLAAIRPLATSLVALPITTALAAAFAIVMLDRTLARCEMAFVARAPLLIAFAVNPLWVFYAGNGTGEVISLACLALVLYALVSWYATTEPRYLMAAGLGVSLLVLTRYAFFVWAAALALLIGTALLRRRAPPLEIEGSVVAFAAPVVYALALWTLLNALVVDDPFGWIGSATSGADPTGVAATANLGLGEVAHRLLELSVAVFPLAWLAVPLLVVAFVSQRNDMALWLASLTVGGIALTGAHAYLTDEAGLLALRDALPMTLTAFVGAAWAHRSFAHRRGVIWAATLVVLVAGVFTAWRGMQRYPHQSLEQAFVAAVRTGDSQEGRPSRGGFTAGTGPERLMASYVEDSIRGDDAILTDEARTSGVILLSGRPRRFSTRVARGDAAWRETLERPYGRVRYLLLAVEPRSDDLVRRAYPELAAGGRPGFEVVLRTSRYVLARVARRDPRERP